MSFTWVSFFEELADRLWEFEDRSKELILILEETGLVEERLLKDTDAAGNPLPLEAIDPFSFLAVALAGDDEKRMAMLEKLRERFHLAAILPQDLDGLPRIDTPSGRFFPAQRDRKPSDVLILWRFFADALCGHVADVSFREVLGIKDMSFATLTLGLYYIRPKVYLPLDNATIPYLAHKGLTASCRDSQNFGDYLAFVGQVKEHLHAGLYKITFEASAGAAGGTGTSFWVVDTGVDGAAWRFFREEGLFGIIGCGGLGDLAAYADPVAIENALREQTGNPPPPGTGTACFNFCTAVRPGDFVFARRGRKTVLGYGCVEASYEFDAARQRFKSFRRVRWFKTGEWVLEGLELPDEALAGITNEARTLVSLKLLTGYSDGNRRSWWFNANRVWNFINAAVGEKVALHTLDSEGNDVRDRSSFEKAQTDDIVVMFIPPLKKVVSLWKVTKVLHDTPEGEAIEIEKTEQFAEPLPLSDFSGLPALQNFKSLSDDGLALGALSAEEWKAVNDVVRSKNSPPDAEREEYRHQHIFLEENKFNEILTLLEYKKNIILQGPPGTGKTYLARRLAYVFLGHKDDETIEMVQFHQSYSYEDFIQGYRPTDRGAFEVMNGVFYDFCKRAESNPDKRYFFIIDEINRGNISRIFGELMLLIEADKRGPEFAIPLTYSRIRRFHIPSNVYLIGTMNTADRSLALVDYALRRRFCFITLEPQFHNPRFRQYLADNGLPPATVETLIRKINRLNERIARDTRNLGPGYRIGHSYFCPQHMQGKLTKEWLDYVFNTEIVPMIREYWFDNEAEADEIIAELLA